MTSPHVSADAPPDVNGDGSRSAIPGWPSIPPFGPSAGLPAGARKGIFSDALEAAIVVGFDGRILECNAQAEALYGYTRAEMLHSDAVDLLVPGEHRQALRALLPAYNEGHRPEGIGQRLVWLGQRADGTIFENELTAIPVDLTEPPVLVVTVRVLGEMRKLEEMRYEGAQWVRATLDATPIGMALVDLNGAFLRVNAALCRLTGYSEQDLLSRTFSDITHPAYIEPSMAGMRALREGRQATLEIVKRYIRADGRLIWVRLSSVLIRDANGKPSYFISQMQDVTERHEAKEALRRSEAKFRAIFDNAAVGLARLDAAGWFVQANAAFQRLVHYSEAQLCRMRAEDITHKDDLAHQREITARVMSGALDHGVMEKRYIAGNGDIIWTRVTTSRVDEDGAGGAPSRLCVVEDITEERRAVEATQRLAAIVESSADAIYSTDIEGRITSWNSGARHLYGYAADEIIGRPITLLYPPEREHELEDILNVVKDGRLVRMETERVRRDEGLIPVSSVVSPIFDAAGTVIGASGIVRDVSERVETERKLQRYRLLSEAASDLMVFTDARGLIVEANESAARFCGCTREELMGKDALSFLPASEGDSVIPHGAISEGPMTFEVMARNSAGRDVPMEVHLQAMTVEGQTLYLCIGRDISERKEHEKQLARQAFYDPLTDIPNRALFVNRLGHALSRTVRHKSRLAVLFLDLDRFKVLNDSKGHLAGDQLLIAVAGLLRGCLRVEDTIARFGGDEFTILLEDIKDEGQATRLAERILRKLQVPLNVLGQEVFMTASIGIAFGSAPESTAEDLLRHADLAMYRAKSEGKARYSIYLPHLGSEAEEQLRFESELHRAIELNEFHVHYQPVVLMETGQTIGVEALARWQHPRFGLMPPDEFVPLQEQIGLIEPFTMWVLRESLNACLRWHQSGRRLSISVNLSAYNLHMPGFAEHVAALAKEVGFPPSYLKLEITESAVMIDPTRALHVLNALAAMGIRLSMDDFGTGYSSLAYLKQLPVQEIKIDKSFVLGMDQSDEDDAAIVRATIDLAHNLRKKVVAEGVETQDVWDLLNILGCDAAQGFYMARPMPAAQVTEWLDASPWGMKARAVSEAPE